MILTAVIEMMTARIAARSRRQAMDWSLVLISQGIESVVDFNEAEGWGLIVAGQEFGRAEGVLSQYQAENRHWPWRRRVSSKGVLFDWGCVAWVLIVGLFFWVQTHSGSAFREAGLMDAVAVSHGEWWRLFTAIFLHADLGHFAMNAAFGFLLLGLTMGNIGTGFGLLAAYLAGAGGNIATWIVFSAGHRSLGASGMVMGCVGLLAAQSIVFRRAPSWKVALGGVAAGAMLFALLGLDPGSDVLAHLGGFVSGLMIGGVLLLAPRLCRNSVANVVAGLVFCGLVVLPWWLALRGAGGR
jgi:membrane associated rhomboid family serine protease